MIHVFWFFVFVFIFSLLFFNFVFLSYSVLRFPLCRPRLLGCHELWNLCWNYLFWRWRVPRTTTSPAINFWTRAAGLLFKKVYKYLRVAEMISVWARNGPWRAGRKARGREGGGGVVRLTAAAAAAASTPLLHGAREDVCVMNWILCVCVCVCTEREV